MHSLYSFLLTANNAGTLELLLKISSGISASPAEEKPAESINLSEHWSRKKIEDLDFWFLKPGKVFS